MNNNLKIEKMTNEQILEIAKLKSSRLLNNTQQRLQGGEAEKSLWVFNMNGTKYIGHPVFEGFNKCYKLFKNKEVFTMSDKNGNEIAFLQKL